MSPPSIPRYARVALDVPLVREFDYQCMPVPPVGSRLVAPFAHREIAGIVVGHSDHSEFEAKTAVALADALPPLPADWLALVRFAADYYGYPFGQALFTALPTALRQPRPFAPSRDPLYRLTAAGRDFAPRANAAKQIRLHAALAAAPLPLSAARTLADGAARQLADWQDKGVVEEVAAGAPAAPTIAPGPEPTAEQAAALAAIPRAGFDVSLLFGVTGSGKTEVYLRLVADCLAAGRQALVLVPEINLTPQLETRFRARFPATRIVSLNSGLADGERANAWCAAWAGEARLVLGTRLAVFTPLPELGLIVVDEEHDASFKQQDGLRYSARDLAVWRAHQRDVPIVLGSATPSLESWANAEAGRYRKLELSARATAATLPEVRLVDIRRLPLHEGLSQPALDALVACKQRGEISLVYVNRRGYSPVLACTDCGWLSACPRCSAKLVLHWRDRRLRCHHCGHAEAIPHACPGCGNPDLKPLGQGTQRVEAALAHHLPGARILRIDRDTTSRRDAWGEIYRQVLGGEVDVLVGTQMLAKGHDFPALSLVVALNTDGGLYSADFRASENLFAQLAQVAGRAGRADKPGTVLVQTQWPEHPLYQALQRHDYPGFAATVLAERRATDFPPYSHLLLVRADAERLDEAMAFLASLAAQLPHWSGALVYDPAPASMARLANRERAQLLIQSDKRAGVRAYLQQVQALAPALAKPYGKRLRWSVDVDPLEV